MRASKNKGTTEKKTGVDAKRAGGGGAKNESGGQEGQKPVPRAKVHPLRIEPPAIEPALLVQGGKPIQVGPMPEMRNRVEGNLPDRQCRERKKWIRSSSASWPSLDTPRAAGGT